MMLGRVRYHCRHGREDRSAGQRRRWRRRGSGQQLLAELCGQQIEIQRVNDVVVIEIALTERPARLRKAGGECVEVRRIHRPIVIRVGVEEEENCGVPTVLIMTVKLTVPLLLVVTVWAPRNNLPCD